MIEGLLSGLATGIAYGMAGYFKNKEEFVLEEFEWDKFLPTVIGTGLIGMAAFIMGGQIDIVASSAIGLVITQIVLKLWKAQVWRIITDKFK